MVFQAFLNFRVDYWHIWQVGCQSCDTPTVPSHQTVWLPFLSHGGRSNMTLVSVTTWAETTILVMQGIFFFFAPLQISAMWELWGVIASDSYLLAEKQPSGQGRQPDPSLLSGVKTGIILASYSDEWRLLAVPSAGIRNRGAVPPWKADPLKLQNWKFRGWHCPKRSHHFESGRRALHTK